MKKQIILYLLLLISVISSSNTLAQGKKNVEANPINVAVMLMQRTDTASMTSACQYYGYTRQSPQEGYTIFTHPNGSTIRYKYVDSNYPFPTLEVTSKIAAKERDQILKKLKFEKVDNTYEQKSIGYSTRCTFGPHGTLIFTRVMKKKE